MLPPARFIIALALAASCAIAPGQLPAPTQAPTTPPARPAPTRIEPAPAPQPRPNLTPANDPAAVVPSGPAPDQAKLKSLTRQLGSDEFKARETAQIELSKLATKHPGVTLDAVLESYLRTSAPEARFRLRTILYNAKQEEYMRVPRGFVGIMMYPSFARGAEGQMINAIQVRSVVKDSAAEKHGLLPADQIISVDGRTFDAQDPLEDFASYVTGKRRGDEVELMILRNNREQKIKLILGQRPPDLYGQDYRAQERFTREFKTWLDENSARLRAEK